LAISADVGIHHLYFTHEQIDGFDTNFHSAVPFRTVEDRDSLREAVRDGTIDSICSDHAPHDNDAKLAPFPSSAAGLSAFDAFIPLLLGLPDLLSMSYNDVIAKVTSGPARIVIDPLHNNPDNSPFGAANYSLDTNNVADLVLIDPLAHAPLNKDSFLSQGLNTPLIDLKSMRECTGEDVELKGSVRYSVVAGELKLAP